jgi:ubiquinone/menaquinone biosynthesis C-methylase UbiE
MVTVLCFLKNPLQGLIEATRVLKPHGLLVIGIIDPESPLGRSYEANKEKSRFYHQARFHRVRQVLEWLEKLGYSSPRICQTIFQDLPTITASEAVREGYGDGAFVVIAGQKPALSPHLSGLRPLPDL